MNVIANRIDQSAPAKSNFQDALGFSVRGCCQQRCLPVSMHSHMKHSHITTHMNDSHTTTSAVRESVNKSAASAASLDYVKFRAVIKSAGSAASLRGGRASGRLDHDHFCFAIFGRASLKTRLKKNMFHPSSQAPGPDPGPCEEGCKI